MFGIHLPWCVQKIIYFSSFLDIWKNVEWPRFLDHPVVILLQTTILLFILPFLWRLVCGWREKQPLKRWIGNRQRMDWFESISDVIKNIEKKTFIIRLHCKTRNRIGEGLMLEKWWEYYRKNVNQYWMNWMKLMRRICYIDFYCVSTMS